MNKRLETSIPDGLAKMREAFPANQISKLPAPNKKQTEELKANYKVGIRCQECGQWHHKDALHLDYVGHAALTDRLLDCDPNWSWEPLSVGADGYPVIDRDGGMWIKLTVCGVTRLGYGDAQGKTGGNAMKERIGDALRNAAMRFGAALELWHKGELHVDEEPNQIDTFVAKANENKVTPTAGAGESLEPEERRSIERDAESFQIHFDAGMEVSKVIEAMELQKYGTEQKVYCWSLLDSKLRSAIMKHKNASKVQQLADSVAAQA